MPLTAAMIGFLSLRNVADDIAGQTPVNLYSSSFFISSSGPMISLTLPPEQNPLPVPVSNTTLTSSS